MPRTKISEFSSTPASNTDIDSIFIGEGMAPSNVNDAIRELMAQLKDWQSGTSNDPYVVGSSGSLTLNQGTANGVLYLNGSKVATSGSALWFDGTNFGVGTGGNTLNHQSVVYKVGANAVYQQIANGSTGLGATNGIRVGLSSAGVGEWYSPTAAISYIDNSEQMRLTSTGLGIGTSSPTQKLQVKGIIAYEATNSTNVWQQYTYTDNTLRWNYTGAGSDELTMSSSGNLGLGVEPSAWGGGYKGFQINSTGALTSNGSNATGVGHNYYFDGTNNRYLTTGAANLFLMINNEHRFYNAASGTAGNAITFTQAMTLDASGNLLVGTTSGGSGKLRVSGSGDAFVSSYSSPSAGYFFSSNSGDANCVEIFQGRFNKTGLTMSGNNTGTITQIDFFQTGTSRGSITTNNSTTSYNTSSDYRLKENIQPMTGALARVAALKPCTYKWKEDGSEGEGFIAHELQAVVPNAVTGEKDAVREDGSIKPQGIDTSFLVATLTAALQELDAKFEAYKATHP